MFRDPEIQQLEIRMQLLTLDALAARFDFAERAGSGSNRQSRCEAMGSAVEEDRSEASMY